MAIATGTATSHTDLFAKLRAFLKLSTGSGGPGWTERNYDGSGLQMLFVAPGLSGTEEIGVGLSLHSSVSDDAYNLGCWMYRAYNAALAYTNQPGSSVRMYHLLWNQPMTYWFIANGQRVIIVTKVSTVYTASYLGKILIRSLPGDYPQPYYVGTQSLSSNTRWSTPSFSHRNFWDPGDAATILSAAGTWVPVRNFLQSSSESQETTRVNIWPFSAGSVDGGYVVTDRYRELRENLDGTYSPLPLEIMGGNALADEEIYGELDGAFAVTGFSAGSEDTASIGGEDHMFVQDIARTARYNYAMVRLA